jgi:hypothetical protein
MDVINKIDGFLNEAKKSKSGYYKVGVSNDYSGPIKVMEIAQESNINKARQAYAGKYKYVFTQPASKEDFADFSNGKIIKWTGPIKEAYTRGKHNLSDKSLETIANTLNDREWFILAHVIGFKPNSRKNEIERNLSLYNVPIKNYEDVLKSLINKKVLGNNGKINPYTRDIWNMKFPNTIASQIHQVVPQLKF